MPMPVAANAHSNIAVFCPRQAPYAAPLNSSTTAVIVHAETNAGTKNIATTPTQNAGIPTVFHIKKSFRLPDYCPLGLGS